MSQNTIPNFDDYSTAALCDHINTATPIVAELGDDRAALRETLRAELDAAIAELNQRKDADSTDTRSVAADGGPTISDVVDRELDADTDDHFLYHVDERDTTFSGRHERVVDTNVVDDTIIHHIHELYSRDAHGESLSWRAGVPRSTCPVCDTDLDTSDDGGADSHYVVEADCPVCPFAVTHISQTAPIGDADYRRPVAYEATIPHDFDDEDTTVDWAEMRADADPDADITTLANIVRALTLQTWVGRVRDMAYDHDDGLQTVECGHCGDTVDAPAAVTHEQFGAVCPDCEGVEVWSADDADLPADVRDRMDTHKSFTADKLVALLRDVQYYADYLRTNLDDEERRQQVTDGIKTGAGGKRDATGRGNGKKGTHLRRPNGAFHGDAHWRTVLADAKETGLIERADDLNCDDESKGARWRATDKGREVFATLARCRTCGERKHPYKRVSVYDTHGGKYTNKDTSLALACPDCDELTDRPGGMTISSSQGSTTHVELDGVDYDV